jgi:hypothetical protein
MGGIAAVTGLLFSSMMAATADAASPPACIQTEFSAGPASLPAEGLDPVVAGNNVYAAYTDPTGLVFEASSDGGRTWTSTVLDPHGSYPRIAAGQGNVYVTWVSNLGAPNASESFAVSSSNGKAFGPVLDLGLVDTATNDDFVPQIATTRDGVVVVFAAPNADGIVAAVSPNKGASFKNTVLLAGASIAGTSTEEVVAASGTKIFVGWITTGTDGLRTIQQATSSDGFATYVQSTYTPVGAQNREPIVTVSPSTGTLYLVYRDDRLSTYGLSQAYLASSTDFGVTWSAPVLVDPGTSDEREVTVAADGSNVYVAYMKFLNDYWNPSLVVSQDGGVTFSPAITLGNSGLEGRKLDTEDFEPQLWAGGNAMHVGYNLGGSVYTQSTVTGGVRFNDPLLIGTGSQAQIAWDATLWIGSAGQANIAVCNYSARGVPAGRRHG